MEGRAQSCHGSVCTHPLPSPHTPLLTKAPPMCVSHSLSNKTKLLANKTTAPGAAWALPEPSQHLFSHGWHTPDGLSRAGEVTQALGRGAEAAPCGLAVAQGAAAAEGAGAGVHSQGEESTASLCMTQSANAPCLPRISVPTARARGEHPPREGGTSPSCDRRRGGGMAAG